MGNRIDSFYSIDIKLTRKYFYSALSKLTVNAFLKQRVFSINSISELCEKTVADVNEVAKAIDMDSRIGPKFLNASVRFRGSCFQKYILNLVFITRSYSLNEVAGYWDQVILINEHQKNRFSENIVKTLYNTIVGKKNAFLGWAFNKRTNDTREYPAITVAENLLKEQANILYTIQKLIKKEFTPI